MAMPDPAPQRICRQQKTDALRRLHRNGVAPHLKLPLIGFQLLPHTVQVHGVGHHGVVVQNHAQAFAMLEVHGAGLAKLQAIELTGVALHIARLVQLHLALGAARVKRAATSMQIGQGQHAPAVVSQADAGVI